jgi:hypothetical protein
MLKIATYAALITRGVILISRHFYLKTTILYLSIMTGRFTPDTKSVP